MDVNYKNWVPKGMIYGFAGGAIVFAAGSLALLFLFESTICKIISGVLGIAAIGLAGMDIWCIYAYSQFSYTGKRKLSKQVVEGTAEYVRLPKGGVGLDVGCGSGALTIAAAKRNPESRMVGCDRWGMDYASFTKTLCEQNAAAENVQNIEFKNGDATNLPFDDESFDCVTSNYVYHNIPGDKQKWLLETLRVLKKGGSFAIHDLMSKNKYGDMQAFMKKLREMGYEKVELIDTANGKFMSPKEAKLLMLESSAVLYGKK